MSAQVATPSGAETQKEKKSKFRLSNPFSHKETGNAPQTLRPEARDSAYGGSETTSDTSPALSSQAIPTITQNQADMQGAPVETKIDARGKVVTTTTTTVTTTTTTTEGDSLQVPAGEEVLVKREERQTTPNPIEQSEQPAPDYHAPSIPARNDLRNRSPHGGHLAPHGQPSAEPTSPTSPTHQNFSYPGRQSFPPNGGRSSLDQQNPAYRTPVPGNRPRPPMDPSYGQPPLNEHVSASPYSQYPAPNASYSTRDSIPTGDPQYPPRQSTAQSIRTAAAGIHGAGETIRGALNSSIAKRTGGTSEEIAQHNAIVERGRREIETGHFQKPPTVPAVPESAPLDTGKEKKSRGLKNVLRKKSQERAV